MRDSYSLLTSLNFAHWLVLLGILVSTVGSSAYIFYTLKGETKPNRISWGMWALAPFIGTAAALSAHGDVWMTVRIFLAGFFPFLVFLASFINPKSYWKLTVFDLLCGAFSFLAILIWYAIDSPTMAILLAAVADGSAALPTIVKAWKYPETETGLTYITGFLTGLLFIPSIPHWDIANSAFQIYLLFASGILTFAVYRRRIFGVFL